ncbi:O-antigen polymerase [Peribacillus asahii]|uniref:O-antigen polymerase n=1 Tax=Peribacillus asahii TaxID=228899 RepID=UPI0020795EB4|nr:O-antigen polymerase [Peribacillus asahii]USK59574.1 oligosaccharide repeat unit polymerase [Peribacillus asahii]
MDIMLFILYYTALGFSVFMYLHFREKSIFSISDAIVLVTFVLISLGGYFNSYGSTLGFNELNYRIFLDYFIFFTVVPFGLVIGSRIRIKNRLIYSLDHNVNVKKVNILLFFVICYALFYFYFIKDSIPLLLLLTGQITDTRELALIRLSITHDYDSNYNIPFILRYYQLIINDLMRFILSILFLFYLENKKKYRNVFILALIAAVFFHSYHFEKSGLIYIVLILFFNYILFKGIRIRDNITLYFKVVLTAIVSLVGMYMVFMGVESIGQAFKNMVNRAIIGQTGMIYYQDMILQSKYGGVLWGQGVPTFLLDSILNREIINISKEVYAIVFSTYVNQGGTGTTGGMPMFFLRSNFGYLLGTMMLLILSIVTGMIDNILKRGIGSVKNKKLVVSLYSVAIIYFVQAFIGNFTKVYMLPFVFSPQIIIVILATLFLIIQKNKHYKS